MIRLARPEDLATLQEIERAAGEPFRALGMDAIADDEPPAIAVLESYQRDGRAWVSTGDADSDGEPVGYLLLARVDGDAHVEQVSVHPRAARRGLGAALIEAAARWATERDIHALTLITFGDVPWNRPYYERLGFRAVPEAELTDGLRRMRRHEAALGLDRWSRVVMRRALGD